MISQATVNLRLSLQGYGDLRCFGFFGQGRGLVAYC